MMSYHPANYFPWKILEPFFFVNRSHRLTGTNCLQKLLLPVTLPSGVEDWRRLVGEVGKAGLNQSLRPW
jgi:hypothetical protein